METSFKLSSNSLEDTSSIAKIVANGLKECNGGLICLYGDIGAGKTALVREIAKHLGVIEKVTSPSFVILNEYHSGELPIYHFDLYRLEKEGVHTILDEIREYTESENVLAFVEWAEFSFDELPDERLEIYITYDSDTSRTFSFKDIGQKGSVMLKKIIEKSEQ